MRALVTARLPGDGLAALSGIVSVDVWEEDRPIPREVLLERVARADGLLCMLTDRVDAAVMDAAGRLRVISQMAVGVDNVDLEAAAARGIPVGHTPDVLVDTTADLTWGLLLAVARRIVESDRLVRTGGWRHWSPEFQLGRDVHGATLGIVGMGAIGRAVARRAAGFDMEVVYASRSERDVDGARRVELDDLLPASDFVSVHVALTAETRGLIGRRELSLMRPSAILVNTARGGVVDEVALVEALDQGGIAGAGLDVYATEPLPPDSPLLRLDNVVLLPHIGSASVATRTRMARLAVANLLAGLRGEPLPHPVSVPAAPPGRAGRR